MTTVVRVVVYNAVGHLDELLSATQRLKVVSAGMNQELVTQNERIDRINDKADVVGERVRKVDWKVRHL